MDAFYASVEQLDFPELKGKPIVVGGEHRGVVAAASYEARKFGVFSAMSSKIAKQRCPDLIFVMPRFKRYKEISHQIREIFYSYTDLVEPLSLDEAYLDVTENKMNEPFATKIAKDVRNQIFEQTGLTASAGISINKFLAKVASDYNKPNGQKTILPEEVESFLETLSIKKFYGVGKVTAEKMHQNGIFDGKDLKGFSKVQLTHLFGKSGEYYYDLVRGFHYGKVNPNRERKSVGVERTFWDDIFVEAAIFEKLEELSSALVERMQKSNSQGRTLSLKLKYHDFTQITRSKTLDFDYFKVENILEEAQNLWLQKPREEPIRLMGLTISNLQNPNDKPIIIQLKLPFPEEI